MWWFHFWRTRQYQVSGNNSTNMQLSDGASIQKSNGIIIANKKGNIEISGAPKQIKLNGKVIYREEKKG